MNKINRNNLLYSDRHWPYVVPEYWTKSEIKTDQRWRWTSNHALHQWIVDNLTGLWSHQTYSKIVRFKDEHGNVKQDTEHYVILSFEDPNDKLMFDMMGAELFS